MNPVSLSVKALILDRAGRYLLLRRSSRSKANGGRWDFPGGKIALGETIDQALLREIYEETGLQVSLLRVAGAAQSDLPHRVVAYLIFEAQSDTDQVRLSDEHDQFIWVSKCDLSSVDVVPQFRPFIESLTRS